MQLIKQSVQNFAPFEMSLQGVGGFPDINQPRTLWMGVDEGADCLRAHQQKRGRGAVPVGCQQGSQ